MSSLVFSQAIREIGDFFLPQTCLFCGNPGIHKGHVPLCERCLEGFIPSIDPMCPCCGLPYLGKTGSHLCEECRESPPSFHWARSFFLYKEKGRDFILHLKFHGDLSALTLLHFFLEMEPTAHLPEGFQPDLIVPVPLSREGLRKRGYNQALLLALGLAEVLNRPVERANLQKKKRTPPQIGLTKSQRKRNIRKAFVVKKPENLEGKKVLLVDDVYTTGATAGACTETLLKSGAHMVGVWTFARTAQE